MKGIWPDFKVDLLESLLFHCWINCGLNDTQIIITWLLYLFKVVFSFSTVAEGLSELTDLSGFLRSCIWVLEPSSAKLCVFPGDSCYRLLTSDSILSVRYCTSCFPCASPGSGRHSCVPCNTRNHRTCIQLLRCSCIDQVDLWPWSMPGCMPITPLLPHLYSLITHSSLACCRAPCFDLVHNFMVKFIKSCNYNPW